MGSAAHWKPRYEYSERQGKNRYCPCPACCAQGGFWRRRILYTAVLLGKYRHPAPWHGHIQQGKTKARERYRRRISEDNPL